MLEEAMRYVNNRFDADSRGRAYGSASGAFSVSGGTLEVDGLKDGQYFWVEGSALNDGLHLYPDTEMADEDFEGQIVFLVVPRAFADLCDEVSAWLEANADALAGPYQSESFGGYSYQLAGASSSGSETAPAAWQARFGARFRPYRKLSRDWV